MLQAMTDKEKSQEAKINQQQELLKKQDLAYKKHNQEQEQNTQTLQTLVAIFKALALKDEVIVQELTAAKLM